MRIDYHRRFIPVIRYLEQHFNEPLNLANVASLANLSPYHFHRIFKAVQGETLSEFIRRLRLQAAADHLFKTKQPVLNVALDFGFSSSQSLAKAFQQHFGVTPTAFRECKDYEAFSELTRDSKIGHTLRKNGHGGEVEDVYLSCELSLRNSKMKTQHFTPSKLAYIRVTGPYGVGYDKPSARLHQWAALRGIPEPTSLFIYHDNPEITPSDKCRTDICLRVPDNIDVPVDIELQDFSGGLYAVLRREITDFNQYSMVWEKLMTDVIQEGLEMDDRPCFELYNSFDPQTMTADVSFCTAIK
ncbi:AraC family transcriptional regulator [Veronia pacifica]|uniref:AraC family transcriptional regulator n=1 Tax=Veronia pacifica TaxID=1080227 RepID=A0A1C3ESE0_9GAMM|nr:helix-turn-helix domain-containing protein [Veronia pacifica]ODA36207.1 AraC family transcriptional regulator [Veronia pacifica]